MIAGKHGADAAGLAFGAIEKAAPRHRRLDDRHRRAPAEPQGPDGELEKIVRVIKKLDDTRPHATLLVMDSTIGQNAHSQVETFKEMVNISGLVMTKLDGSARGGVVVGLAEKFGLPVHAVGVGEGIDDLRPFEARAFARALMGLPAKTKSNHAPGKAAAGNHGVKLPPVISAQKTAIPFTGETIR